MLGTRELLGGRTPAPGIRDCVRLGGGHTPPCTPQYEQGRADMRERRARRGELALPRPVTVRQGSAKGGRTALQRPVTVCRCSAL